jgi:hypothetical protein
MTTKLTLTMDKMVIERAKAYARENNKSVSQMVSNYLDIITSAAKQRSILHGSPGGGINFDELDTSFVDSFTGILKNADDGRPYKEIIHEIREERFREREQKWQKESS